LFFRSTFSAPPYQRNQRRSILAAKSASFFAVGGRDGMVPENKHFFIQPTQQTP
jgi:hypothetical protein